jgi:uncharacterized protein (DUF1800 family)
MGREHGSSTRAVCSWVSAALVLFLGSCAGGSSGADALVPGPDPPASDAQSARFLTRSTFGPTTSEIHKLSVIGYTAWFDEQSASVPSLEKPVIAYLIAHHASVGQEQRVEQWWKNVVARNDQLRQRVAFALSEIFVVSDQSGALVDDPVGVAEYYDTLVRDGLGNYRTLLEDVTKAPVMGRYLSMLKNQKADLANNIRPDENYAREVMQLFTIGLVELNQDGSTQLDSFNQPIPTYDQSVVEGFAAVFTGWNYAHATSWQWPAPNELPMEPWEAYHETAPKTLLDGVVCPGGQTAQQDLTFALDLIFQHPNVGPFIGRQLIQRLVTSNPSPAYIARAAAVFADDGTGQRGNLLAVVKAILTDPEAVTGNVDHPDTFGKLKEPLLRLTALWRAFNAAPINGIYKYDHPEGQLGQAPLRAASVFNFFTPVYQPPGDVFDAGLVAPEFQITTEQLITTSTNRFWECVFHGYLGYTPLLAATPQLRINAEIAMADDPAALVEHLNQLLMCGEMSSEMRNVVESMVTDTDPNDLRQRVLEALYLIVTSPEYSVQK